MSDNLPKLSILLLTYKRTEEAMRTIRSTCDKLNYPKELRSWYVADDGSPREHHHAIMSLLKEKEEAILGHHNERLRQPGREDTHSCGIGWNRGLGNCHQSSDFVLVIEDDWELERPLDLIPYVNLLQEREDVGMCSFRILSVGADVHTVGYDGRHYLRYARTTQYAYSGNPHLRHARYTKRYGWFAEDRNPGLIELHQDDQYRLATENLIDIWRPLGISVWGGWSHIGQNKTWS